jgi:hypothetical protein
MNTRGFKWPAVGLVCLALVLLGAHLAWEQHRYRLHTPKGMIRIGMTRAEVEAVLGKASQESARFGLATYEWGTAAVVVAYDRHGRVTRAVTGEGEQAAALIPRPSLVGLVRTWLTGEDEE